MKVLPQLIFSSADGSNDTTVDEQVGTGYEPGMPRSISSGVVFLGSTLNASIIMRLFCQVYD
ncbi:MAG: hypothetical protein IKI48_03080 [Prevotella sp.]|nr:hypothetical protein [Prevotella sp.]MBR7093768.1 hypothetical protein [Prevotella sp.]